MNFTADGVIDPGLHQFTLGEVYCNFVEDFSTSQTRNSIFKKFLSFMETINLEYTPSEVWIDGSYVTNKINPNDIDMLFFLSVDDYLKIGPSWDNISKIDKIDAYYTLAICEDTKNKISPQEYQFFVNRRNYWKGQFGFNREDIPKGIIIIAWDKIAEFLEGGDVNVDDIN